MEENAIKLIMEEYIINWYRFKIHYDWDNTKISVSPWNNWYWKLEFNRSEPKIVPKFINALNEFYYILVEKEIL